MPEPPEQRARRQIDAQLIACGWLVQDYKQFNATAGRGIALREAPLKSGTCDYLLLLDRQGVGVVEAKKEGTLLSGVAEQTGHYAEHLPDFIPAARAGSLPFLYESTGVETFFRDERDPAPRSRRVFAFHRPETLAAWLAEPLTLRARLALMPLDHSLWRRLRSNSPAWKREWRRCGGCRPTFKRYRAAVLKAACEGRLVPTEAELAKTGKRKAKSETAETLLARILTERRQNWVPEAWSVASLDQLCGHITSGSRDWSQLYGRGAGIFILAQNIRPMKLDLSETQSVAAPKGEAETERTRVRQHDILVTIVGAKTGDVCSVQVELEDHFVCQSVALLRPVVSSLTKFVELYLASQENGQSQWKTYIYGQGRPHLGFEQLRMTPIPLPPLAEQARIVGEVERRLSVVDELDAVVSANLQRATRLRQSILQKAFTGNLV